MVQRRMLTETDREVTCCRSVEGVAGQVIAARIGRSPSVVPGRSPGTTAGTHVDLGVIQTVRECHSQTGFGVAPLGIRYVRQPGQPDRHMLT